MCGNGTYFDKYDTNTECIACFNGTVMNGTWVTEAGGTALIDPGTDASLHDHVDDCIGPATLSPTAVPLVLPPTVGRSTTHTSGFETDFDGWINDKFLRHSGGTVTATIDPRLHDPSGMPENCAEAATQTTKLLASRRMRSRP